jgi:hypothetical protein
MSSLHLCPHCRRHHRGCERLCPFCEGELPACEAASAPRSPRRISRAMLVAASAAALGGASCNSGVPLYGVPIMDLDSGAGGSSGTAGTGGTSSNDSDGAAADAKDAGAGSDQSPRHSGISAPTT